MTCWRGSPLKGEREGTYKVATKQDRTPDWDVWRHIPDVRLWEGVALSLGIEPTKVKFSPHAWMAAPAELPPDESEDFKKRLMVSAANFGKALIPTAIVLGKVFQSKVALVQFIQWAKALPWMMPAELEAMADKTSGHATPQVSSALAIPVATKPPHAAPEQSDPERPARILRRFGELRDSGAKGNIATLAEEEGVSTTRINQLLRKARGKNKAPAAAKPFDQLTKRPK